MFFFQNGQMSMSKCWVPAEKSYHQEYSCVISKLYSTVINNVNVFKKSARIQGQGYKVKNIGFHGSITKNTHVKYQNSSIHYLNVINEVKVFRNKVKLQGQGQKVKIVGTHGKVLSQKILM